jgi:hypothetical protein
VPETTHEDRRATPAPDGEHEAARALEPDALGTRLGEEREHTTLDARLRSCGELRHDGCRIGGIRRGSSRDDGRGTERHRSDPGDHSEYGEDKG